ncbi:MAG: hypothetical protein CL843_14605 [Crocinitomicaceae bacterium]|nr:hypothetical protein [Crocinitomicaceae bacterium]
MYGCFPFIFPVSAYRMCLRDDRLYYIMGKNDMIQAQAPWLTGVYDYIGHQMGQFGDWPYGTMEDGSDIEAFAMFYSSLAAINVLVLL